MGILITNRISREEYFVLPFWQSQVVYCMKAQHPLAGRRQVRYKDILPYPVILEQQDRTVLPAVQRDMERQGLTPQVALRTQQHNTAFQVLQGDTGYLVMREIAEMQKDICWADLDEPLAGLEIGLVWKRDRPLLSSVSQFVRFVQEQFGNGKGREGGA